MTTKAALWLVVGAGLAAIGCNSNGAGAGASVDAAGATGGSSGSGGAHDAVADLGSGGAPKPDAAGTGGTVAVESSNCPFFVADDPWRQDIAAAPVDATQTAKFQALVGAAKWTVAYKFDPLVDRGTPINIVPADQRLVDVKNMSSPMHDDPGPYPFPGPGVARLEGTDDITDCEGLCRLVVVQRDTCLLFEGQACYFDPSSGWECLAAAKWDLKKSSYNQRKDRPLYADIGGLPIYAGLARYEEAAAGQINHALRFSSECANASFVAPATHALEIVPPRCAGDPNALPLGQRLRLKADYDDSQLRPQARIIVRTLKTYGLILADPYGKFHTVLEDHPGWRDDVDDLRSIPASAFEAIGR